MKNTVLISGASGLIGTALTSHLQERGDRVIRLVRRTTRGEEEIRWDPGAGMLPDRAVEGVDAVVNLSGAGVGDRRWTKRRKEEIRESRLSSTSLLADAIARTADPPSVFLSASAIGVYGQDRGEELLTEQASTGEDFLARVTIDWESAARVAESPRTRVVLLRTGLVLSRTGGLLGPPLLPLFQLGLGGKIGSGRQWMSWVSIDDLVAALAHLIDSSLSGPVNLVAPSPVTNATFTRELAKNLKRPAILPIPRAAIVVRFGREMAEGFALANQRVSSERLIQDGFTFAHPELPAALAHVLGP
jgi:uncharacterized protein (TIGR01777 family)